MPCWSPGWLTSITRVSTEGITLEFGLFSKVLEGGGRAALSVVFTQAEVPGGQWEAQ